MTDTSLMRSGQIYIRQHWLRPPGGMETHEKVSKKVNLDFCNERGFNLCAHIFFLLSIYQ